jgi:hypothetical protein
MIGSLTASSSVEDTVTKFPTDDVAVTSSINGSFSFDIVNVSLSITVII